MIKPNIRKRMRHLANRRKERYTLNRIVDILCRQLDNNYVEKCEECPYFYPDHSTPEGSGDEWCIHGFSCDITWRMFAKGKLKRDEEYSKMITRIRIKEKIWGEDVAEKVWEYMKKHNIRP